jgi:hypothetical protein
MSKEKNIEQMSLLEGSRANHSPLREKDEEQTMIATSGIRLLELYPSKNANGLLARMLRGLLTSKTAWCSDRSTMTWKAKVSKCKVLLFQLAVSVRGIKENVSGLSDVIRKTFPTPTTFDQYEFKNPRKKSSGGQKPPLTQVVHMMYPTPNATNINTPQSSRVERTKSGGFILRKKNKPHMTYGARLQDAMEFLEKPKVGGKLNPTFCEMLMGYPMNWTKIEPTELKHSETQSFHKSQEKSEKQSSRQKPMYRTPTAMDTGEDSFIYAAKILKGKINRNSNSRVQITLSTDVAIKFLKDNPHLIDQYDKPFMVRTKLPEKFEFINYLKQNTSIKELVKNTSIPKTKIEHWFRKDQCFSYPTIADWNTIKPHLKEIKFDEELTFEVEQDWKVNG